MTDYHRCGDLVAHHEGESHVVEFYESSDSAYDGYCANAMMSPSEMPGSPCSVSSDCSNSTVNLDYLSPPSSPLAFIDEPIALPEKVPLKPSLRCEGQQSTRPRRHVTWDPATVFETRPWLGKRRRSQVEDEEDEEMEHQVCASATSHYTSLQALPLSKKPKFTESDALPTRLNTYTSSSSCSTTLATSCLFPIFPEASRTVIPSFDFSSVVIRATTATDTNTSPCTNATTSFVFARRETVTSDRKTFTVTTRIATTDAPQANATPSMASGDSASTRPSLAPFSFTIKQKPLAASKLAQTSTVATH